MITVLNAGLFTTVQDAGRWGYQSYGMPVAGAMDRYAYRVANILAGNQPEAAVLEMTMSGDTLRFERAAYVAICGADLQPTLDGVRVQTWTAFPVPAGGVLAFGWAASGCRAYLAVAGGIDVPVVLGSRATYTRAAVGGFGGRQLKAGDSLAVLEAAGGTQPLALPEAWRPVYGTEVALHVLPGPQDDLFTAEGLTALFGESYIVSDEADRMGYRLEGPPIKHVAKADIVSDALPQGAIQVPGHGRPIVMMADRQTTGGYAKIGTVISSDLARLAQAKPGDTVRFVRCSDEEAVAALAAERQTYADIAAWRAAAFSPAAPGPVRRFTLTIDGQPYAIEIREE